jgi:hypothetical protein
MEQRNFKTQFTFIVNKSHEKVQTREEIKAQGSKNKAGKPLSSKPISC